ncbi:glycosyltransferase family 4 protein [Aetokthonos hydrillicola Thurmond2011]|jgi:glycosyltransferase involved in cell wall biosynthesis|uniref:Glycosyltransferase family 4 protein n=1 Tax=Aetokthonos hydrillicola Thurmond2011 TaxID=2712845 RepID=A0AAP5I938_9CYAN|nr:glycosyltransferase family 4 protein [Aetokthonos hydrillicola]MBO3457598.1 glycosyltransferase family 4 protein [Aetokthonos hydrillicola CCALA 1050]MBW4587876.1 glycosyltransferase family 4 protein [Aetokthonos hydrillicola CCALA 1050]MDR9894720.1 glycosyltransferase family 4 protein [Aetokthonos hydrillicola Thurmond2011]
MTTKKTVAFFDLSITSDSPIGSCILQILRGLCEEYQFIVFADRFENPAPDKIEWIRVPIPEKPVFLRFMTFKWLAPQYYKKYLSSKDKPQLVIGTDGEFANCNICYAHFCHKAYLKEHRIKASLLRKIAREINHRFNASAEAETFAHAQVIVVPSAGLAEELTHTYGTSVKQKITKIPNPVEVSSFSRPSSFDAEPWRAKLGFRPDDVVLIFVALGDFERKGLKLLLQALANIRDATTKLLVVGGSQHEVREYELIRDQLNLSDSVVFVGFQTDVRPFLWLSDLFVFPSNYETFSLVTFQAAVAGLPVMVTNLYGVEEFLEDKVNGWLVERDTMVIAQALKTVLENRDKLPQIGAAANATASKYNKSIFVERWRLLLESLI